MNRIPVVIAGRDCLSGVTTWAEHLRSTLAYHPGYEVKLLHVGDEGGAGHDIQVKDVDEAYRTVCDMAPLILAPNYVWELYMAGFEPGVACLGMCHADSDEQYYRPLSWYEPTISHFIAVSSECGARLKDRLPFRADDVTTLPYGVPLPRPLRRDYKTDPLRIIYAGRVTQLQKRVWDFFPLVESLLRTSVPFVFDIVGEGDQYQSLQEAMTKHFPHHVRFHARVPYQQMPCIWSSHDVFVQTSDFEGTSVSMLEAMAYGAAPVVTAASSGVAGVINHGTNGFVVPVGDMESMAQCIAYLVADRRRLVATGEAAHQTAQAYSLERYSEHFANVLDRIVESYGQVDVMTRYGMFASTHPLFKQRETIADLEARLRRSEGGIFKRLGKRLKRLRNRRAPSTTELAAGAWTGARRPDRKHRDANRHFFDDARLALGRQRGAVEPHGRRAAGPRACSVRQLSAALADGAAACEFAGTRCDSAPTRGVSLGPLGRRVALQKMRSGRRERAAVAAGRRRRSWCWFRSATTSTIWRSRDACRAAGMPYALLLQAASPVPVDRRQAVGDRITRLTRGRPGVFSCREQNRAIIESNLALDLSDCADRRQSVQRARRRGPRVAGADDVLEAGVRRRGCSFSPRGRICCSHALRQPKWRSRQSRGHAVRRRRRQPPRTSRS